ncbi:MAG TPA: thiamine pyrophosphate-dependent enzyme, partial [Candidatus Nanopelagicales bacterium]|nr:thiamine pyrophosphate-dependent enzyme [Candidatus Nanopelagicales bacterium]
GFPGVRVDGNDVLAVLAVTSAALQAAREGQGPTLIEAFTYRMGAHTTSDDPTRYRVSADLDAWRLKDPIERLKVYLARSGWADHTYFEQIDAEAEALAIKLRDDCRSMPDPEPTSMFDKVYAEQHPLVDEERAAFSSYHASFVGGQH